MLEDFSSNDNATYSAFAEDIAVQFCFFDIQLTSLSPRNCIPPEVLFLSINASGMINHAVAMLQPKIDNGSLEGDHCSSSLNKECRSVCDNAIYAAFRPYGTIDCGDLLENLLELLVFHP
ncbi:hypothetical protein Tco_0563377 [Tanacetum coccineum]